MIREKIYWEGVRHTFSPRSISKYELANIINETYKLNIKINEFKTDDNVDKTLNTIYRINTIFKIPDLKEQIKELEKFELI